MNLLLRNKKYKENEDLGSEFIGHSAEFLGYPPHATKLSGTTGACIQPRQTANQ
jgi:hypothetical protein